jgi:hypothetical protein
MDAVEHLTRLIVRDSENAIAQDRARQIAEAQFDLFRIRNLRTAWMNQLLARSGLIPENKAAPRGAPSTI